MSVFSDVPGERWVASNELAFAFRDNYPVSPGHTLIVTRREIVDWFAATTAEQHAILALVDEVKRQLDAELHPDGYNVGFNAGAAAGQTVMHLHVHVIPRYRGDMDDPRGGVRHVIPSRGNYLRQAAPLATGGLTDPFAHHVLPLLQRADDVAIVAAFVQESGLDRIESTVRASVARGARVRILTGDYLDITQASALERLLDWQRLGGLDGQSAEAATTPDGNSEMAGRCEVRVVEVKDLPPAGRAFHPKAWRFESAQFGVAFVGSSNLSRSALDTGIEWNLRVDRDRDAVAYARVRDAFDAQWAEARPLDGAWVHDYAERARRNPQPLPPGDVADEPALPLPEPHEVQREALRALRECRAAGRRRAVVVLATGLGKTWLAAFDLRQLRDELGRQPRLLFLAHRRELLVQAAGTYRRMFRALGEPVRVGWFADADDDLAADAVFASVAKLSMPAHLARLRASSFDYVVIDEVHHAAAPSYQRIIDAVAPRFLLGLTATPDRADAADLLGLFDDFIAYRADIARGVSLGRLVPFHYHGVRDDIDYANLPWKNRRFDPAQLAAAVQTEVRMERLWRAWADHVGQRTLVFCCSVAHADYVRGWLRARSVKVNAVYSGPGSDDREASLAALAAGDLDAMCAVDVFNEGVDVPAIDRVVMLRPTESMVVFLQQLGRGLRAAAGKVAVTVIDFVGNHRIFLERLRAVLGLGGGDVAALRTLLAAPGAVTLPAGCSVDLELEAKELLERLSRVSGVDDVERTYRELCIERGAGGGGEGRRPTAGEMHRLGHEVERIRQRHGGWLDFVRAERGLDAREQQVLDVAGAFLRHLEITAMQRCFKMVTLEVMLEAGQLLEGMSVQELAIRSHAVLVRTPSLMEDVGNDERTASLEGPRLKSWVAYWRRNPIAAWIGADRKSHAWFRVDGDRFVLDLAIPAELGDALAGLTRELVDYRLAKYRARQADGGHTGPAEVIPLAPRRSLMAFTELRAAAGRAQDEHIEPDANTVALPVEDPDPRLVAVRASGNSMDGGRTPLRDGDWVVLRPAEGLTASAVEGQVVLVRVEGSGGGAQYQLKRLQRLRRNASAWQLTSDNPDGPTLPLEEGMAVIARFVCAFAPESLAPAPGTDVAATALGDRFGLEGVAAVSGRYDGHLFLFVEEVEEDGDSAVVRVPSMIARPAETAFVLIRRPGGDWRYLGVGRQTGERGEWRVPTGGSDD